MARSHFLQVKTPPDDFTEIYQAISGNENSYRRENTSSTPYYKPHEVPLFNGSAIVSKKETPNTLEITLYQDRDKTVIQKKSAHKNLADKLEKEFGCKTFLIS